MKPSILIFADFPNWAYYGIQQFVKNNLSNEFNIYTDFLVFNTKKKSKNPFKRLKTYKEQQQYQKVRKDNSYDIVVYLGFYFPQEMKVQWNANKVIKGIYTDGFPPKNSNFKGSMEDFKNRFLSDTDAIVCGSKLIRDRYQKVFKHSYFANAEIDETHFISKREKEIDTNTKFIVGWTGNPKREFKGYYSHVIPAVELAKQKYPNIELKSRFSGPMETLPLFYEDVNICLIPSLADAGPFMFGEASLMNVPCISTDIGFPSDIILDGVNGFIVKREVEAFAEKIIELYENRELLKSMSNRIRKDYLKKYNKVSLADDWRKVFFDVLDMK